MCEGRLPAYDREIELQQLDIVQKKIGRLNKVMNN